MTYITIFINKRATEARIYEQGKLFMILPPGKSHSAESVSPITTYARWSKVTFKGLDEIELDDNKDWKSPYTGPVLELVNNSKVPVQALTINRMTVNVSKNFPIIVECPPDDYYFRYSRIEWIEVEREMERKDAPFMEKRWMLEEIRTPRPQNEIDKYSTKK